MKAARVLWSNAVCAAPWAAVALVLVVTTWVNHAVDLGSLSFDAFAAIPASSITESGGDLLAVSKHLLARVAWGVPAIGFSLVAMAAMVTAIAVTVGGLREMRGRERAMCAVGILLAALCFLVVVAYAGDRIMSEPEVTTNLRKATMHRTSATHAVAADSLFDMASYLIFLLLLSAATATLLWPRGAAPTAAFLCRRLKRNRWLLYVGATTLVLRAIEMYTLYRWPGVWLSDEMAAAVDRMAMALSTTHGAFFSAILMALYLPTALITRLRIKLLATYAVDGTDQEPETWLAKEGLSTSPFQELARVFVTIAPLIAGGSVAKLVEVLAG